MDSFSEKGFKTNTGLISIINEAISKFKPKRIIFTGHSLGGALANVAALEFQLRESDKGLRLSLYTFGQPRVGTRPYANFHRAMVDENFRVVHYKDYVCHKPAKALTSYVHSGTEVWFS